MPHLAHVREAWEGEKLGQSACLVRIIVRLGMKIAISTFQQRNCQAMADHLACHLDANDFAQHGFAECLAWPLEVLLEILLFGRFPVAPTSSIGADMVSNSLVRVGLQDGVLRRMECWARIVWRKMYMERRHSRAAAFLSWWSHRKKGVTKELERHQVAQAGPTVRTCKDGLAIGPFCPNIGNPKPRTAGGPLLSRFVACHTCLFGSAHE